MSHANVETAKLSSLNEKLQSRLGALESKVAESRHLEADLQRSEERFRRIVGHSNDAIRSSMVWTPRIQVAADRARRVEHEDPADPLAAAEQGVADRRA